MSKQEQKISIVKGRHYALIGCGKSTLLKSLVNSQSYLVDQNFTVDKEETPLQAVLKSHGILQSIIAEEKELETYEGEDIDKKYEALQEKKDKLDYTQLPSSASKVLQSLAFAKAMLNEKVASLSGGWRQRLGLACAIFSDKETLLLDEPTNHLDIHIMLYLQDYIKSSSKAIVVVSHDRNFLNEIAHEVWHMEDKKISIYKGNYDHYLKVQDDNIRAHNKKCEIENRKIREYRDFINKYKDSKDVSKQKKASQYAQELEDMKELTPITKEKAHRFFFKEPEALEKDQALCQLSKATFGYKEILFQDLDCSVFPKDRIAIMGNNGCGKSTLVSLLLGKLTNNNKTFLQDGMRYSFFTQHSVDELPLTESAVSYLGKSTKEGEQKARNYLGAFAITGDMATRKMKELSGGEKVRVILAQLTWNNPHLLVFDEPTNHLDIVTIDTLIEIMKEYQGAIIVISHDRYFLSAMAKDFWLLQDKKLTVYHELEEAIKEMK